MHRRLLDGVKMRRVEYVLGKEFTVCTMVRYVSLACVVTTQRLTRNNSLEMRSAVLKTPVALDNARHDCKSVRGQACFSYREMPFLAIVVILV